MRRQYLEIKREYPDCIVFFRLGDFYETFDEDAELVARELDITLTSRSMNKDSRVPMAGVPHHALENYIARLIEKGYHVAVCDQMSEPNGRGIVEREVTRVLTPGTITDPELLREDRPNYLMAIVPIGDVSNRKWQRAGVAYTEISTGEFSATELQGEDSAVLILEELARLQPREILIPETWVRAGVTLPEEMFLSSVADYTAEYNTALQTILDQFRVRTIDGFGLAEMPAAVCAAGAILAYLRNTQKTSLTQISTIRPYSTASFMVLDPFTRRNLELTQTIRTGRSHGSLLGILDHTVTAMGARLLRSWISQPLLDIKRLNARLDAVEAVARQEALQQELRSALSRVSDLERLTNRLITGKAGPRDLIGIRDSLDMVPVIQDLISEVHALAALKERIDPSPDIRELIFSALQDEPPATLNSVGIIRSGYSSELDEIMAASKDAREWIAQLEPKERRRTGIASLKVGFNKVFGYYIEVTNAHSEKIPSDYIRKQTLVNAERYITPELKEYETLVLNAEEEILKVERRVYADLCEKLSQYGERLLSSARSIAHLDALLSLAITACREGYVRPQLRTDQTMRIRGGRHPVVEKLLDGGLRYVANDTGFDEATRIHIITGPNMSGKSTYIRQVAIIALMAQIGSFVPADEAEVGLVDRIFARIGAQDEIHAGQSTFMVEMVETARLLAGSSSQSLLILDEIGRGTSTYDGLAIARSVIEYIHNNPRLNCRTLFATHYHELTELPNILPRTRNYNVAVTERGEDIVFLHRVVPGGADRSYGVHVAQIAGMPRPVIDRARELLAHLEDAGSDFKIRKTPTVASTKRGSSAPQQLGLFSETENPAVEALRALEIDSLSPLEALTKLYELKRLATQ